MFERRPLQTIYWDPATETEMSYWTERFPLDDSLYHPETEEVKLVAELSPDDIVDHGRTGWKRRRGLRGIRSKDPLTFKAMYQQERDQETAYSDFSDEVLAMAEDHHRSFRQLRAHEIRLLGVDPARKYGAAWVLLAVDKSEGVVTIADFFWGENLGYTGIKEKLILNPISRYEPSWLCYEDNIEGAALADTIVWKTIESLGISVWPHRTGMERGNAEIGPGALATWMREGRLRIPFQTAEDKARAAELKRQFKAWDSNPSTKRRRAGQAGYAPDDLCMATWVPWLKAAPMIDSDLKDTGIVYGVPKAIKRKFDLMQKQRQSRNALRAKNGREANPRDVIPRVNPLEAILSMSGEVSEED